MDAAESSAEKPQKSEHELSRADICAECARRFGKTGGSSPEEVFSHPLADFDIFEDKKELVNRLYYIVPEMQSSHIELFVFFEENRFKKLEDGELVLTESSLHIEEEL